MKLKQLDLHGVQHWEVNVKVMEFVYLNQEDVPLEIIAGNSDKMIKLVERTLTDIKVDKWEQTRYGVFVIRVV